MYHIIGKLDILHRLKHALHDLGSSRRPGAVFDKTDGLVLDRAGCKVLDVFLHKREDACIVGRRGKHYASVAEGICNSLRHIASCEIIDSDRRAAVFPEHIGKCLDSLLCMSVY